MFNDKLKELQAARAKLVALESVVEAELRTELASLPQKYGFHTVEAFVHAVRTASGGKGGRGSGRKARVTVTDQIRAEAKKMLGAGKKGAEIAERLGISGPTVQNIKKALGLVKERK